MAKLTLNVDAEVVAKAKEYAEASNTSVSAMVENYLKFVTRPRPALEEQNFSPILKKLSGSLKGEVSEEDYKRYLEKKYL